VWVDGPSDYPVIEVQLYRDGEAYGNPIELDGLEQNPWTYTWTGLAATDINGIEYVYSIDELTVPEGYTKHIDGLTITNIFDNPEEPEIPEEPGVELPETGTSYPWHQSAAMLLIGGGLLLLLVKRKRNNG
jgi:LPXTG-motif cell wall-anchored protein